MVLWCASCEKGTKEEEVGTQREKLCQNFQGESFVWGIEILVQFFVECPELLGVSFVECPELLGVSFVECPELLGVSFFECLGSRQVFLLEAIVGALLSLLVFAEKYLIVQGRGTDY